MNVSSAFKTDIGHANLDFVDICLNSDTELFIDPCLIETVNNEFCHKAKEVLVDFFDSFYGLYSTKATYNEKYQFFSHMHEINYTKLGYGNGDNGKAKTAEGMIDTFSDVERLMDMNIDMSHAIDLPIFIENFAEDCMSDMITNILFEKLSEFTVEQCKKYGVKTQKISKGHYYWDLLSHSWKQYNGECWCVDGKNILLVPKCIVRKKYYYCTTQYFSSVIVERIRKEKITYDSKGKEIVPNKKTIEEDILKNASRREIVIEKTAENPNYLKGYHYDMEKRYNSRIMTDEELDNVVYLKTES